MNEKLQTSIDALQFKADREKAERQKIVEEMDNIRQKVVSAHHAVPPPAPSPQSLLEMAASDLGDLSFITQLVK